MSNKSNTIDIEGAVKFFFELPDWKERVLKYAGAYILAYIILMFVYIFAFLAAIVPFIGIFIFCGLFLFVIASFLVLGFYFSGYKLEVIDAVATKKDVAKIAVYANYQPRVKEGFKVSLASFVYMLPSIAIYVFAYAFMIIPIILEESSSNGSSGETGPLFAFGLVAFYGLFFVGWILQMLTQFVVLPAVQVLYAKERNIMNSINPSGLWIFIKKNYINLLLFLAVTFGVSMVMGFAAMLSMILIFVFVGIILYPIVFAVGSTYILHLQAHLIGQLLAKDA